MKTQAALFPHSDATADRREDFEVRIRAFARAVALRHRGRADVAGLLVALRGYHRMLTLFATSPVPPLDESAVQLAIDSYVARKPRRNAA